MPTPTQVQNLILSAQLKAATLTNTNQQKLTAGVLNVKWDYIRQISRYSSAVLRQYELNDFTSSNFLTVYDWLSKLVGGFGGGAIDPNYQGQGITIITEGGGYTPPSPLTFTQADLVDAGDGNYYLPFSATGVVPTIITVNGVSIDYTIEAGYTPPRIYGFANNDTQVIIVNLSPGVLGGIGNPDTWVDANNWNDSLTWND